MRENKYRAWYKNGKRIMSVYGINFIRKQAIIEVNEKGVTKSFLYFDDCIFEQYIGLKDKNGIEIYEGDIVILEKLGDKEEFIVSWDEDSAKFVMSNDSIVVDFDCYYGHECEIIGNIHEREKK